MLNVSFLRGDNGKELLLPIPNRFIQTAAYTELSTADTGSTTICITAINSPIDSLNELLPGMEMNGSTLNELEFLSRRLNGLENWEQDILDAALKLEQPRTLGEIVNLSCNQHKYDLLRSVTNEEQMGRYLLKQRGIKVPESIDDCIGYDQVARGYLADHPGVFTDSGFVSRKDEPLDLVYDGQKLPEPYCDSDGIITVRLNPMGKPQALTLTLPTSQERLEAVAEELGVRDFSECYASYSSTIPGLMERLPNYDGLECLNLTAAYLGESEEKNRLFMAVMEAEVPASMYEIPELTDALSQYHLLPENIKTPEDYAHYMFASEDFSDRYYVDGFTSDFVDYKALGEALMKENGVVMTSFGIVERYDRAIRQLPEELNELRLFSPLTACIYAYGEYGDLENEPMDMSSCELCDYKEQILEAIQRERLDTEGDRGLAVYLHNVLLGQKVHSMNPTIEEWHGELWGVLEVQTHGDLSEGEMRGLIEAWEGQCSDGWGEGFEQREIKIDQGELNVSFWNSGRDFSILPEQELKSQPEQCSGMQMMPSL